MSCMQTSKASRDEELPPALSDSVSRKPCKQRENLVLFLGHERRVFQITVTKSRNKQPSCLAIF